MLNFILSNFKRNLGKIEVNELNRKEFDLLRESLKVENKAASFSKNYTLSPFNYCITPLGSFNIGVLSILIEQCDKFNILYNVDQKLLWTVYPQTYCKDILQPPNPQFVLRDYQLSCVQQMLDKGRGVIVVPTRGGKSLILGTLCDNMLTNNNNNKVHTILIIVPNIQLVPQMWNDFKQYGYNDKWNVQQFTSSKHDIQIKENNIFIANIQYLMLHGEQLGHVDMIIQDEVHSGKKGSQISKLVKNVPVLYKFGCTGTLPANQEDIWNIFGIFGKLLYEIQIKKLQEKDVLCDVQIIPIEIKHNKRFIFPKEHDDPLEEARGMFRREREYLSTHQNLNNWIGEFVNKLANQCTNENTLVIFDLVEHGNLLFNSCPYTNKHYIDGSVKLQNRLDIVQQMDKVEGGNVTFANAKCFGTGLTIKYIHNIVICSSGNSVTKFIQAIGRGLLKNKQQVRVFDLFSDYKYSTKHFEDRTELYQKFYNVILNKDYKVKSIILN